MGKRQRRPTQTSMWVATQDLPRTAAHLFYTRLNQILDKARFDDYVESLCQRFYANEIGRPGLPPGRYFRLPLIGYFEGLDAERAIAWRAADSFALRAFLGLVLPDAPPDHSTISRTRRLIDLETHEAVFTWMLQRLADVGLVKGNTVGIDATTLEANAALRSIVRRDTGEGGTPSTSALRESFWREIDNVMNTWARGGFQSVANVSPPLRPIVFEGPSGGVTTVPAPKPPSSFR